MTSTTGDRRGPRCGLTLIEMMVVMAVIITIASIVVVSSRALWGRGQRENTLATLEGLKSSIELFKGHHGGSVPSVHPPEALIDSNAYPANYGIKDLYCDLDSDGLLAWLKAKYKRVDPNDPARRLIVDGYGRPFVYDTPPCNFLMGHRRPLGVGYILYSLGPDGRATPDPTDPAGDDIRNYREWR